MALSGRQVPDELFSTDLVQLHVVEQIVKGCHASITINELHNWNTQTQATSRHKHNYSGCVRALSRTTRCFGVSIVILESLVFDQAQPLSSPRFTSGLMDLNRYKLDNTYVRAILLLWADGVPWPSRARDRVPGRPHAG